MRPSVDVDVCSPDLAVPVARRLTELEGVAARVGADVTASDLTPSRSTAGRRDAAVAGVSLIWQHGDAEDLPSPDTW